MRLKEFQDTFATIPRENVALIFSQVVDPMAACILNIWWKVIVHNIIVDFSSRDTRSLEATNVSAKAARHPHETIEKDFLVGSLFND